MGSRVEKIRSKDLQAVVNCGVSEMSSTAFEKFHALTKKVISVPKSKIDAREAKYRQARKPKNRKRHR